MAGLRRNRFLSCHFCGTRTNRRFDGFIRQFACAECDAVNWLDENGEITDPPFAATTSSAPPLRFATTRSPSPAVLDSGSIFCQTCLKNQRLFTTSLAQYYPDDPNDPEYEELDRNYYRFRKGLEQRYPQVCDECRPKVEKRLDRAGYTAKTDHLRRMLDTSRKQRSTKSKSSLDYIHGVGRTLWVAGLLLQLLWHLTTIMTLIGEPASLGNEAADPYQTLLPLSKLSASLPLPHTVRFWCMTTSLSSFWWNPRFVQTMRGFTRHITGIRTWYCFQALILAVRYVCFEFTAMESTIAPGLTNQLVLHTGLALFTVYIYSIARKSVVIDHSPLFRTSGSGSTPTPKPSPTPKKGPQTMAGLLDEILAESPAARRANIPDSPVESDFGSRLSPASRSGRGMPTSSAQGLDFGSMGLSNSSPPETSGQNTQYSDEMEWTPTTSPHRAFNSFGSSERQNQGFGASPTAPDKGPFWYKVPPAPTNPLARLRNPPTAPLIRPVQPVAKKNVFANDEKKGIASFGLNSLPRETQTTFAQPRFFTPVPSNDPRNTLSEMFGRSFTLSGDEDTEEEDDVSAARRKRKYGPVAVSRRAHGMTNLRRFALLETVTLIAALAAWVHALRTPHSYTGIMTVGIVVLCSGLSARATLGALMQLRTRKPSPSAYVSAFLGAAEMLVAAYCAHQIWLTGGRICCVNEGVFLLGAMTIHRIFYAFL